ncbi:MAG: threonine--tRNA ligase [Candidatus Paceibacterota bacterium]|jgi:threonyl-tRNA synthetase
MEKNEKLHNLRHTLAHLTAAAVGEIYKFDNIKLTLGPDVDNGFYYDIDFLGAKVADTDLKKIEDRMRKILPKWTDWEHKEVTKEEALKFFGKNEYKTELINEIAERGEKITTYTCGGFTDLCRGGHLEHPSVEIDPESFKLDRVAGAYWRGDEKNKMLTRIYGLAFETKDELDAYVTQREEAIKRDHRKIAKEQDLLVFSDLIGSGMPMFTPKGNIIRNAIINFSRELNMELGFGEVHTPNFNKAELFKISGHYDKYKEDMLTVRSQYSEEDFFLKPMNCPQHTQIYASRPRSYRDLPIRYSDFANLYRDERPGELSGLTRLRCFAQDDGHTFCREDQIKNEFESVLVVVKKALDIYKMDYKVRLSLWDPEKPEKYLGSPEVWEQSQKLLEDILNDNKIEYEKAVGEAAIYGPKMDIITKDSLGREWQISTIQLDLIMPQRFKLTYMDSDGKEKTPVMIHRAIIGSPDRFMGILIEHYAGAFPLWLSPVQVKVIPVRENHNEYAKEIFNLLKENGIRAELDDSDGNLGGKVRDAKNNKMPYWVVIGDKEIEAKKVTLESRDLPAQAGAGQLGQISKEELLSKFLEEIKSKK